MNVWTHFGTQRRPVNAYIRGGADKSLAPNTSRCRRTESTVSLEREVCSCAELQDFFLGAETERKHFRRSA